MSPGCGSAVAQMIMISGGGKQPPPGKRTAEARQQLLIRSPSLLDRCRARTAYIIAKHQRQIDIEPPSHKIHRHAAVLVAGGDVGIPAGLTRRTLMRIAHRHYGHGVRSLMLPDQLGYPVHLCRHIIGYRLRRGVCGDGRTALQAFKPLRLCSRIALVNGDLIGGLPTKPAVLDVFHYLIVNVLGRLIVYRIHIGYAVLKTYHCRRRCDNVSGSQSDGQHGGVPVHRRYLAFVPGEQRLLYVILSLTAVGKHRRPVCVFLPFLVQIKMNDIVAVAPDDACPFRAFGMLPSYGNIYGRIRHYSVFSFCILSILVCFCPISVADMRISAIKIRLYYYYSIIFYTSQFKLVLSALSYFYF